MWHTGRALQQLVVRVAAVAGLVRTSRSQRIWLTCCGGGPLDEDLRSASLHIVASVWSSRLAWSSATDPAATRFAQVCGVWPTCSYEAVPGALFVRRCSVAMRSTTCARTCRHVQACVCMRSDEAEALVQQRQGDAQTLPRPCPP